MFHYPEFSLWNSALCVLVTNGQQLKLEKMSWQLFKERWNSPADGEIQWGHGMQPKTRSVISSPPQRWRWERDALRAKSQTPPHCEKCLVPKVLVCGSQDLESDKPFFKIMPEWAFCGTGHIFITIKALFYDSPFNLSNLFCFLHTFFKKFSKGHA